MAAREWHPVDPGIGKKNAEPGSQEWAERMRLDLCGVVKDLPSLTEHTARMLLHFHKHRGWTLLRKPEGPKFRDWSDFCAYRQPFGLGVGWATLEPYITPHVPKEELDLLTAAPDQRGRSAVEQPRAKHGEFASVSGHDGPLPSVSGHDGPLPSVGRSQKRLRAIADRAPAPVKQLYADGLIGQTVAAKLGPAGQTPEVAAKVTEIGLALAAEAKALPKATPKEKAAAKRVITAKARELLGVKPRARFSADPPQLRAALLELEPMHQYAIVFAVAKTLPLEARTRLVVELKQTLEET